MNGSGRNGNKYSRVSCRPCEVWECRIARGASDKARVGYFTGPFISSSAGEGLKHNQYPGPVLPCVHCLRHMCSQFGTSHKTWNGVGRVRWGDVLRRHILRLWLPTAAARMFGGPHSLLLRDSPLPSGSDPSKVRVIPYRHSWVSGSEMPK